MWQPSQLNAAGSGAFGSNGLSPSSSAIFGVTCSAMNFTISGFFFMTVSMKTFSDAGSLGSSGFGILNSFSFAFLPWQVAQLTFAKCFPSYAWNTSRIFGVTTLPM